MSDSFEAILKRVPGFALTSAPFGGGAIDVRSPKQLELAGSPCGLVNEVVAAVAITGVTSHRMLIALSQMLAELMNSPPEEIADRMRELVLSLQVLGPHFTASSEAINAALARVTMDLKVVH